MKKIIALLFVLVSTSAFAEDHPNILWLTCEDNNVNWIGCYGNPFADTPNIDKLATEGVQYMHCYANAPVCAPMRSTWITGVHALSMGTHPMRSRYPIPHETIKYYPDLLKKAGYYVGNAKKTDYNIGGRNDKSCWDTDKVDWSELKKRQPFFMVINSTKSHESKAFGDVNSTTHSPADVRLAKYHPDIPDIRKNYAHYHDQMKKMDADIGQALADLEASGMADNTIVIHNSDHGGVIARSKRFLFNSGTHCPLIIRIPDKFKHLRPAEAGSKVDELVSFINMTKTWLNICGAETPDYMQGKVFLGPNTETRDYHVSFRGRMDERCDNVRAIRDQELLYVRNYMPYAPWGQKLNYLWKMKATQAWEQHHSEGKTNSVTGRFFRAKPMEELYDTTADPDNVNNLIDDPKYAADIARLGKALDQWQLEKFDSGLLPETEVVKRSEESGKTIYELVRDPALYDLKGYQNAAEKALQQDSANLAMFYENLKATDSGIRYWAIVGCFNLQPTTQLDMNLIKKSLSDQSHHVRAMAAWILYRDGDKKPAQDCWNELLASSSYASLKILNIIDWIGDGTEPYAAAMAKCEFSHQGFVPKMLEYMGVDKPDRTFQGNGLKIGEVTQTSAIVWTRLTSAPELNLPGVPWPRTKKPDGKSLIPEGKTVEDMEASMPGIEGSVQLSYWSKQTPDERKRTKWMKVDPQRDFTHQFQLTDLSPGVSYQLEVRSRSVNRTPGATIKGSFRTAPPPETSRRVSFTVVTGQDYPRRDDPVNGHKIYPLMHKLDPDFFVHTGDIEYYDKPNPIATNVAVARFKWNRLFGLPNQRNFHNVTASYFIKDDHDTLKNDCWPGQTYGELTWDQGLEIFREQFPLGKKTYRTIRWGKDLQVWFVEGRDFRSPNNMPDGPEKTIWGEEQKQWFFETVAQSDATFKILISPTPLVGPDRAGKGDNHANVRFAHEGKQLRDFIGKQKNMFICCGDRHWQYVSVDPNSGVREFSCGPTSNKHAGGWSNDKRSPMHQYLNVVGGFLSVTVEPGNEGKPVAIFRHYSTDGKVLNEDRQPAR